MERLYDALFSLEIGLVERKVQGPANRPRLIYLFVCTLVLVACGPGATSPATPSPNQVVPPPTPSILALSETIPESAPTIAPPVAPLGPETVRPVSTPAVVTMITPTRTVLPPEPITLRLLSPLDGSGLEVGAVRVMGTTSGATIDINGLPAEVAADGSFQRDLLLRQGVNLLEVVASVPSGRARSEQIVVYVVVPTAGLPFSLLYPIDGVEITEPAIPVIGVTMPDAVVGVNGIPAEVNHLGIFSTLVSLEEGANLIEVVATDIRGEVRFQTVVVFYTP